MHGRILLVIFGLGLAAAASAIAGVNVTINARDNILPMSGKEPLVGARQGVIVKAKNLGGGRKYAIHIYPDTAGWEPTSSSCKGELHSTARPVRNGRVTLGPIPARGRGIKPWCKGIVYRGDLHYKSVIERRIAFCVKGSEVGGPDCEANHVATSARR